MPAIILLPERLGSTLALYAEKSGRKALVDSGSTCAIDYARTVGNGFTLTTLKGHTRHETFWYWRWFPCFTRCVRVGAILDAFPFHPRAS